VIAAVVDSLRARRCVVYVALGIWRYLYGRGGFSAVVNACGALHSVLMQNRPLAAPLISNPQCHPH